MAVLTTSPLLIALMQTAASLPVLILGLPAGATADMFDRRRLLIFWQTWMLISVAILGVLTFAGVISPWALLAFTFLLNIGAAMNNPAWQAIVPELVPREELSDAIALNSAGYNLARAVGPALGGLGVAAFISAARGASVVFLINSLSFLAVIFVLYQWRRKPLYKSSLPAERLSGSMRAGVRYLVHAPELQAILIRAFLFTLFAIAVWALLAVVAQHDLHRGAMAYGILNGCLGLGAVAGASSLAKVRQRIPANAIVLCACGVFIATLCVLALVHFVWIVMLTLIAAGFAWTSVTSTLNAAVQLSVPDWVQARALGLYQTIFMGGMAGGSALWGELAERYSTKYALLVAAGAFAVSLPLSAKFRLRQGAPPDMSPYHFNRPVPDVQLTPLPEDGPVMVTIEYLISPEEYEGFTNAIHQLRRVRMRDGAVRWGVYRDTANPGRLLETFVTESWLEFLRERERMTAADRVIRDRVRQFHHGPEPVVSYMIYAKQIGR